MLIFGDTGAAGLAAAQISRIAKAKFLIISENKDTYARLIHSGFADNEIILCKDGDISSEIRRRTKGTGADVIFSHKTADSDLFHNCALSLAPSSRIVLFGQQNSRTNLTDGLFDTSEIGVSSFDLADLCHRKPRLVARYTFPILR